MNRIGSGGPGYSVRGREPSKVDSINVGLWVGGYIGGCSFDDAKAVVDVHNEPDGIVDVFQRKVALEIEE